ncbi:MAG: effector-associated domain EAD1-containing protein [Caldilineaceae bacterium]
MKITGQNVQQICDALIDAYPTRDLLRMMVRVELDRNLEEIAGGENQNVVVFNLVSWAERDGRIDELIERAHLRTPGNAALSRLAAEWRAQTPPGTAPQIVSPLTHPAIGPAADPGKRKGPASVDLFLSYSRKDNDAMHLVQESLRAAGLSVWTDEGLEPGTQSWKDAIAEAVKQAYALVVLLSPNSSQSTWVKNEVGTEGGLYPWGNRAPTAELANYNGNVGDTTAVGHYSPQGDSPYGLVDMAGGIWEWVSSQYRPYPYDATDGREDPAGDTLRSQRGGSWDYSDDDIRCAFRGRQEPGAAYDEDGFRVAYSGG